MTELRPMHPIHPGEILADELGALGLTAVHLAQQLQMPEDQLSQLVTGKTAMTADTALRLEQWLGVEAAFWLYLQTRDEPDRAAEQTAHGQG